MDILVDTMQKQKVKVWDGCNPIVKDAVEAFSECLPPYSLESSQHSLYRLIRETIDSPWQAYLDSLKDDLIAKNLLKPLYISRFAKKHGFRALEDKVINMIRSYLALSKLAKTDIDKELVATLETMREISFVVQLKRPRKTLNGVNALRARQPLCELCGNLTEMEERRKNKELDERDRKDKSKKEYLLRFSSRYCTAHRPWNHDKSFNSNYRRAFRNKNKFENELLRLKRQTATISKPIAKTGDHTVDLFVHNVVTQRALYADEQSVLRNIAHQLNEKKITDNKKRIVIMLWAGMNQSEIAKQLGITRQTVSKSLKKISIEFRFDKMVKRSLTQRYT